MYKYIVAGIYIGLALKGCQLIGPSYEMDERYGKPKTESK